MTELKCSADAIAEATRALYPGEVSTGFGVQVPYYLGGNDPLEFVEVYLVEQNIPYWHYITYGFSELYDKEVGTDDDIDGNDILEASDSFSEESGYGFELSFRLKKTSDKPPVWPVNLLQNLARYVFSTGNVFSDGHHLNCNGPIALETDTKLSALVFLKDSELGTIKTTSGKITFLQVVGITCAEMEGLMCWNSNMFLNELLKHVPDGITDLERECLMENSEFYKIWENGVERDGSNMAALYMNKFSCRMENNQVLIQMGAGHVHTFIAMLKARVNKNRVLYITAKDVTYCFQLAAKNGFGHKEADFCLIELTPGTLKDIFDILKPHKGEYVSRIAPLKFVVEATTITDSKGNILEVIE